MADLLLDHLGEETEVLESLTAPLPGPATEHTPGVRTLTAEESFGARPGADRWREARRPSPADAAAASIAFKVPASIHHLEVEDPGPERVELAPADDRVARHAGLPGARRHLGDHLAGQALLVELALAGDDRAGRAHPRSKPTASSTNAGPGHQLGAERRPQPAGQPAGGAGHRHAARIAGEPRAPARAGAR